MYRPLKYMPMLLVVYFANPLKFPRIFLNLLKVTSGHEFGVKTFPDSHVHVCILKG